ncbi:MAG: hypothetical protein L3J56_00605 [Bacteroidales bacterium]|nr:hypothetical protein [Bacteroidales bacterium]
MRKLIKKNLILILKITIVFFAFWYIWIKIKNFNLSDFSFPAFNFRSFLFITIVIVLMPINWLTESYKWKFLLKKFEIINLKLAFRAVLSGISFALISPNRIGELVGRVFVLKNENREKAVFITAAGSLSQMMITVVLGSVAGIILLYLYPEKLIGINSQNLFFVKIISISVIVFGFLLLFNLRYLVPVAEKLKVNVKFIQYIKPLTVYSSKDIIIVLCLSLLRYAVFSVQFVFLLYVFKTEITVAEAFIGIALTYFISSLIPVLTFLEIGIRGMAAVFFLGMFSPDIPGILSATAVLWIINLAVPGMFGTYFFVRTKI